MIEADVDLDKERVEGVFRECGFGDFRWLSGIEVVVSDWVRMKCMFGCDAYGKGGCCPPTCHRWLIAEHSSGITVALQFSMLRNRFRNLRNALHGAET